MSRCSRAISTIFAQRGRLSVICMSNWLIAELENLHAVGTGRVGVRRAVGHEESFALPDHLSTHVEFAFRHVVQAVGAVGVARQREVRGEPRPHEAHAPRLGVAEEDLDHLAGCGRPFHQLVGGRWIHRRHLHQLRLVEQLGVGWAAEALQTLGSWRSHRESHSI